MRKILAKFRPQKQTSKPSTSDHPKHAAGQDSAASDPEAKSPKDTTHDSQTISKNAPLEALPPEVRRHLLTMLEFEELKHLVRASPVFHQQYHLDRKWILSHCLDATIRNVPIEAYAVLRSGSIEFSEERTRDTVTQFIEDHQKRRSISDFSILSEDLTLEDIVLMVNFHCATIQPLVSHYAEWALGNLARDPEVSLEGKYEVLSETENARVIRALYRFQLCCQLFGVGPHKRTRSPMLDFKSADILKMLECLMEPWEIEEVVCVRVFGEAHYQRIFDEINWDVNEENPKFEGQGPPTPRGAFDLQNMGESFLEGTLACGLELLNTAAFKIKDHSELVSTMQKNLTLCTSMFIGQHVLSDAAQQLRRQEAPSDRDLKEQRRDPLVFQGDRVPDPDGTHAPLAWTLIWGGTYSNIFGDWITGYMEDEGLHHWGYVMWDADRLEATGAKELLARQMKESWGEDDIRDDVW